MAFATSLQPKAILAMPATLRPVLLGASTTTLSRARWTHTRLFSVSPHSYAVKYPNVAALVIPEFQTSTITDITPDDLFKTSSLFSAPGKPLEGELNKLFTRNPAAFAYAESDFYKLKKNTRVPEVCILGRSNVGKSSLVNAVANRQSSGLAYVSKRAGKTRSINTYGFGPAPTIQELQGKGAEFKDEEKPTHTFHLVDMPGYGYASQQEWGKNISLYLKKRTFVKGAIVLIDAEVGPKDSDFHLLELLSAAQLKTAVILTKADKVKKGLEGLRETCKKVWDGIRTIEIETSTTTEGGWAWEKDVFVTAVGARDAEVVKATVTTARLAIARMAGLVKNERPNAERNQRWAGKVVSFDDLQYIPTMNTVSETKAVASKSTEPVLETPSYPKNTVSESETVTSTSTDPVRETPSRPKNTDSLSRVKPAFTGLDRTAKSQRDDQPRKNTASWSGAGSASAGFEQAARFQRNDQRRKNTGSYTDFAGLDQAAEPQRNEQRRKSTGSRLKNKGFEAKRVIRKPKKSLSDIPSHTKTSGSLFETNSGFAALDQAARTQNPVRPRVNPGSGLRSRARPGRTHTSAFYSTTANRSNKESDILFRLGERSERGGRGEWRERREKSERPAWKKQPADDGLIDILNDFVADLKAERNRGKGYLQQGHEMKLPAVADTLFRPKPEEQYRLKKKFRAQTDRSKAVLDRRLEMEERERQAKAAQEGLGGGVADWGGTRKKGKAKDINEAIDASTFEDLFAQSPGLTGKKGKNKFSTDEDIDEEDSFDDMFAKSPKAAKQKAGGKGKTPAINEAIDASTFEDLFAESPGLTTKKSKKKGKRRR